MIGSNILLTLVVGSGLGLLIWKQPPPVWTAMPILGLCLVLVGFILWTTARFQLGKSLTVTAQAKQLVTHGLYSKFRNPIYIFGSSVIAGFILVLGRPQWLIIFLIIIPLQVWRGRKEAQVLAASFGEDYRQYCATTWF